MERRLRSRLKTTGHIWRVDETYVRVKGKWVYLYRAVDSRGATIDFLLSAKCGGAAAERFWPKPWAVRTIRHRGSSTPTRTQLTRRPSCNSKPRALWRRTADIDRCSTLTTSWSRITGP